MGFSDRLKKAISNIDFNDVVDSLNSSAQRAGEQALRGYEKNLSEASDSMVLAKLREAETKDGEWGARVYEAAYDEARRRGLL